jgi:hypothetical protein
MRKMNIFYLCIIAIFYFACSSTNNKNYSEDSKTSEKTYIGKCVDDKKSGEWIETEKNIILKRDYYLLDTIILSMSYTKDGKNVLYCQYFVHGFPVRQVVFDQKLFKEEIFSLSSKNESDQRKGLKLYSYYCKSCHSSISKDVYLQKFNKGADDLFNRINSLNHPTKFYELDSLELKFLRKYISQE